MRRDDVATHCCAITKALRDQVVNHVPRDVGEAEVPALEAERELEVVEAEEVEDGRVDVVDMHRRSDG